MNLLRILVGALVLITVGLTFNQWQLQRAMEQLQARVSSASAVDNANTPGEMTQDPERRFSQSEARADRLESKLAAANTQIAQLEQRLRQLEGGRPRQPVSEVPSVTLAEPEESFTNA